MANLNRVYIIGRLTKDPQVFGTVTRLNVATTEKWKDKQTQEWKESSEFHKIVCFGYQANYATKYGHKGAEVFIEGRLKTSSYEKDGQKIYSTDIVADVIQLTGSKPKEGAQNNQPTPEIRPDQNRKQPDFDPFDGGGFMPPDDDIPF